MFRFREAEFRMAETGPLAVGPLSAAEATQAAVRPRNLRAVRTGIGSSWAPDWLNLTDNAALTIGRRQGSGEPNNRQRIKPNRTQGPVGFDNIELQIAQFLIIVC
jgi:hypothetical protein